MPRIADPRNEVGRNATERWRARLRAASVPEACHVDTALAAAVSLYLARVQETGADIPEPIKSVIADTLRILEARGFAAEGAKRKTMGRLLYRRDRLQLQKSVARTPRRQLL